MPNEIVVTSGSDVRLQGTITPPAEFPLVLTGFSLAVLLGAGSVLQGRISAAWTNQAQRQFQVVIEGTDPLPPGSYPFRVQLVGDGLDSIGTPPIVLRVI